MSGDFELPDAEWVTVGTVGPPGRRTFYLQACQGGRLVTLKLEKQQVVALAQLLSELLADLPAPSEAAGGGSMSLAEPVEPDWVVGIVKLAYDPDADRIVMVAEELGEDPEAPVAGPGSVGRLGITRVQAAALVRRGIEVVGAGRPPCPLCGHPIDPGGHACPRTNGHRQRRS